MPEFIVNPLKAEVDESESRAPLAFHRKFREYKPTRLVDVQALADRVGVGRIVVKDESSRLGLPSFKILGASWGTYSALDEHVGSFEQWERIDDLKAQLAAHLPLALAAATDGNHGRAVARMAHLLGLGARIFVPAGTVAARIEAIRSEGALCDIVDGTYEDAVARAAEEAGPDCLVISDTSWPGYEAVPRWVIEGYSTIFCEIDEQLDTQPNAVLVQLGVGALGAAAARHYSDAVTLVGVEPDRAACVLASIEAGTIVTIPGPHDSIMAGLNCGTPSLVAWPTVSARYDAFLSVADDRAREGMRALAECGLVAGETGAAGAGGLIELVESGDAARLGIGPESTVLLLATEGATDPEAYRAIVGSAP
jgi:diaminopropionate ammonia-lyase